MKKLSPPIAILEKYKKPVWNEIKKYLTDTPYPKAFIIPKHYQKEKLFHWLMVKNYPERKGKYLRPTLLILTARAMGTPISKCVRTAAAMQISEEWLLIHDDIEDNSLERRGQPALHRIFGAELAINAGDFLHELMWKILLDDHLLVGEKTALKLQEEFCQMLSRTIIGQTVELKWAKSNKVEFSDKDWFFIADGKTAYYTIAGPMRLGATIAGVSPEQISAIDKFGIKLGRCFQLVDDILDLTSDFGGLKKQKGNDIFEGKRTLILGHLLRTAQPSDKKRLIKILGKDRNHKTQKEVDWVIDKMMEYKSIEYAKREAIMLKQSAYKIFEKDLGFLKEKGARQELKTLIEFVLERQY